MYVARLQLYDVNIACFLDTRKVLRGQHGPLAQIGAEVMDEHTADHVLHPSPTPQSIRPHSGSIDSG